MNIRTLFILLAFILAPSSAWAAGTLSLHREGGHATPELDKIWDYNPALVTTVYARDNSVLGYLYREKRYLVENEDVSPLLIKAFLAAEDSAFYEHEGVDLTAIFRAFSKNVQAGEVVQGASTITQQVVKRLLLTSEKSYARKFKEAILSYRLEQQMSKDDILKIYLNEIFLGANAYGVEAAARTYFAKHANELTLAEAALLAGLPKAPSKYNPYRFPQKAKDRQKYVLGRMLELNWITQEEYDQALAEEMVYSSMEEPSWKMGAYYLEEVRRWLIDNLDDKTMNLSGLDRKGEKLLYEGGLSVYTALEPKHQIAAEKSLKDGLEASTKRRGWRGPLHHIFPDAYAKILEKLADQEMTREDWLKVLVIKVDKKGATVQFGQRKGYISVKHMRWCRTPNPKLSPERAGKIGDARKVLKPGDVVWASLDMDVLEPKEDKKKKKKKKKAKKEEKKPEQEAAEQELAEAGPPPLVIPEGKPVPLKLEQAPVVQGALVSIEPPTGDVVALVGGYNFQNSQFNRATQAVRQPGSAFKPFVYSAALDAGFSPASVVMDEPFTYLDPYTMELWQPKNYSGEYYGPTMLVSALAKSRNLVTIRVADMIGMKRVLARAKAVGLEGDFQPYLPVSLGAVAITPINLCRAYTAFARDGSYVDPRLVLSVKNHDGKEIYKAETVSHDAISPQNAYVMSSMLKEVVRRGTGARARKLGRPIGGKTGTTNEERDAWFMGFSPYLLTGVYVGFDQIKPMGSKETGARAALPIWLGYRMAVEQDYPEQDFTMPDGIIFENISSEGFAAESGNAASYYLPFMANAEIDAEFYGYNENYDSRYVIGDEYNQSYERYDYNKDNAPDQEEYLLKQLF